MRKLLVYVFLFFIGGNLLFAQRQVFNKFDENGLKHGAWKKHYRSGKIRYFGQFQHGKEVGEFYFYENRYVNDFPSIKKVFSTQSNQVYVTFFNPYGKKTAEGISVNKKKEGVWKYYDEKQRLVIQEEYKGNLLHGTRTVYLKNGKVLEEENYKGGKLHGVITRYNEKGQKKYELTYVDGELHGRGTFYSIHGKIQDSGLYYRDLKVGAWDFYIDGIYMGYKQPNKKKKKPSDQQILENIALKKAKEELIENPIYTAEKDNKLLETYAGKYQSMKAAISKFSTKTLLENNRKTREAEILAKQEKLAKEKVLENWKKKKAEKEKALKNTPKKKKLSDEEILENIQRKNKAKESSKRKLTDEEIQANIAKKRKLAKDL